MGSVYDTSDSDDPQHDDHLMQMCNSEPIINHIDDNTRVRGTFTDCW